jgi:hypothetical protein
MCGSVLNAFSESRYVCGVSSQGLVAAAAAVVRIGGPWRLWLGFVRHLPLAAALQPADAAPLLDPTATRVVAPVPTAMLEPALEPTAAAPLHHPRLPVVLPVVLYAAAVAELATLAPVAAALRLLLLPLRALSPILLGFLGFAWPPPLLVLVLVLVLVLLPVVLERVDGPLPPVLLPTAVA